MTIEEAKSEIPDIERHLTSIYQQLLIVSSIDLKNVKTMR